MTDIKWNNDKSWHKTWGEKNTFSLLVLVQTDAAMMKVNVYAPQKARKRSTAQSSYTTLEHIPKELYILLQSYLLIHIQCCSIYKIHEMERT